MKPNGLASDKNKARNGFMHEKRLFESIFDRCGGGHGGVPAGLASGKRGIEVATPRSPQFHYWSF